MADHDELIQQFSAVSGQDADRSKFFLESANWDLSTALSSFYEEETEGGAATDEAPTTAATDAPSSVGGSSRAKAAAAAGAKALKETDEWSNSDSDESEGEPQAFYTGGSLHSGQQVLGPPRKKDVVGNLFKAAKKHGAEVVEHQGGHTSVKTTFQGTSYRLGETPDDTQVIPGAASQSRQQEGEPVELRMWRTGFTVNDGPLRNYEEEESRHFISDIKKGRIPLELLRASGGREVAINMTDNRHLDFKSSKAACKAFTGSGQTLGSLTPSVVGQVTHVAGPGGSVKKPAAAAADPDAQEEEAKKQLNVDASKPTTNVQIRLTDGSRLVVRANHSQTVSDLRSYVVTARPEYSGQNFALMTTFPHAELGQPEQSLTQANLLNAAIVIKIK